MDSATTRDIEVSVESFYLADQSSPEEGVYSFAYRVQLTNHGSTQVQLISRHWIITDGNGEVKHVRGPGVVGEQPVLEPGAAYEYMSGSRLESPMGTMEGSYQMVGDGGEQFDIRIPRFTLAAPHALN